ncbi:Serine/threonine-protein kinase [Triangularia verruculosa]|uniref:Serine/threonine-protein kinase n=1 Tax=Triangularia verruculosa TaxID=2587418 RepID=A0AAN7AYB4_9PEZI|nr:Serine/threonine-protein kinase [Triangularia verruculosa]
METLYAEGSQLSLAVSESGRDWAVPEQQLTVMILEPASAPTMSVVMKVSFEDARSGCTRLAILKMFDRRFAPSVRRRINPVYDDDAESAWCEYVRDGKAPALFAFLHEQLRLEDEGITRPPRTEEEMRVKKGKKEGIMQWKALQLFEDETRAYATLSHFQGRYIPRFFAQVYLTVKEPSPDPHNSDDNNPTLRPEYFQIPGVLLEYVDGFNLTDLGSTNVPQHKWHSIIQQAVDAARYINDAGVINTDCQPRNVVVQRETLRPLHIDFAQCLFAEDMGWEEFGETKIMIDNQGAIGTVMVGKLQRAGVKLPEIRYNRFRDWGRVGRILTHFPFAVTPWSGVGYGVGVGVLILAWVVVRRRGILRGLNYFRNR